MADPTQNLLKMLSSGVNLPTVSTPAISSLPIEGLSFDQLLQTALTPGTARPTEPVAVDPAAGITLNDRDLERIASATDRAAAAGARSALVLIDGKALTVDVASRTVTGEANLDQTVAIGVDAVVKAPNPEGSSSENADESDGDDTPLAASDPRSFISNTTLRDLLAG